jgi:TonB family protein
MTSSAAFSLLLLAIGYLSSHPSLTAQTIAPLQPDIPKDSIAVQYEGARDEPFQLLPNFDTEKDTAGLRYIPKHSGFNDSIPSDADLHLVKKVEPIYPDSAKRVGLQGRVIVKMWVNEKGKVTKASVIKSDAPVFNKPAIDAAMRFEFAPSSKNTKPHGSWVAYPFQFRLK